MLEKRDASESREVWGGVCKELRDVDAAMCRFKKARAHGVWGGKGMSNECTNPVNPNVNGMFRNVQVWGGVWCVVVGVNAGV